MTKQQRRIDELTRFAYNLKFLDILTFRFFVVSIRLILVFRQIHFTHTTFFKFIFLTHYFDWLTLLVTYCIYALCHQ